MSWRRGKAYSQDLRERGVAAVDGGMAVATTAALFTVSVCYLHQVRRRRRWTGETTARPQRGHLGRALAAYHDAIRAEVTARPDVTLNEVRAWLGQTHGVSASRGGLWNTLDRLGLTLKKRPAPLRSRSAPTSPPRATPGASGSQA